MPSWIFILYGIIVAPKNEQLQILLKDVEALKTKSVLLVFLCVSIVHF